MGWGGRKPARDGPSRDRILEPVPVTTTPLVAFESLQKARKGRFDRGRALYNDAHAPAASPGKVIWEISGEVSK